MNHDQLTGWSSCVVNTRRAFGILGSRNGGGGIMKNYIKNVYWRLLSVNLPELTVDFEEIGYEHTGVEMKNSPPSR